MIKAQNTELRLFTTVAKRLRLLTLLVNGTLFAETAVTIFAKIIAVIVRLAHLLASCLSFKMYM